MIAWLRRWWRILRHRCILCGADIDHSAGFAGPNPRCCRWRNKRALHGMNYGMGAKRLNDC